MRANPMMQKALTPEDVQRWREACEFNEALEMLQQMDFEGLSVALTAVGEAAMAALAGMAEWFDTVGEAAYEAFFKADQSDFALVGDKG